MPNTRRRWTTALVPGFLLILLLIQLVHGFSGFERSHRGIGGILEAPGTLLGWGGVAILLVLFGWLLYGWVGRDLFGMTGAGGLAVRLVGCVAFGVALAGLLGIAWGRAGGGTAGAALGQMLWQLQPILAILVLLLMLVPSGLLAAAPFFQTGVSRGDGTVAYPDKDRLAALRPPPGIFEGSRGPKAGPSRQYPERRFDEDGIEIPMRFETRDVGKVRYADDPENAEAMRPPVPPPPVPAPDPAELPAGVRFADEEEALDEDAEEPEGGGKAESGGHPRVPLAPGVRFADEDDEGEPVEDEAAEDAGEPEAVAEAEDEVDVEMEEEVEEEIEDAGPLEEDEEIEEEDADLSEAERSARYRAKLAGSGFFDESESAASLDEPEPPPKKASKAARKKARATKTTPRKSARKKSPAKKKAAARKKKPAAKKKAKTSKRKKAAPKAKPKAKAKAKPKARATPKKATSRRAPRKKAPTRKTTPPDRPGKAKAKARSKAKRKPVTRKAPKPESPPEPDGSPSSPPPRKGAGAAVDPDLLERAVEAAFERGAASSVLLSRRLGIGYAKARSLMDVLVREGILGEMTASGARPLLLTPEEWKARS